MKWAIELSEFDIRYKSKTTIKGQVLADFVMEFTPTELVQTTHSKDDLPIWKLSVDGASNAQGSGAGLILTSPEGIDIEYALRFGFHASNNEAEYETVIAGLNLSYSLEVDQLEVYSDSQLVVRQIEDTYEAKSETMILYLQKVRDLLKKFVLVQVKHVPRVENSRADALAKLATALQEDLGRSTPVEYLAEPSIDPYRMVVAPVGSVPSWMDPIWDYINDGTLPDDSKEAAKIRVRSSRFTNHKGSLYKRVCTKRSTRGHMRESYWSPNISRKSLEARILLSYNTQRCDRPSQEMQNLSGARQDIAPPVRALNVDHKPLALPTMGFEHIGTPAHWQGLVQVHNRRSRLLH